MKQIQLDHRANTAGLLLPPLHSGDEPRLTDTGLLLLLGSLAYDNDTDDKTRLHCHAALARILNVARKTDDFDERGEVLLLSLLSQGVDPLGRHDWSKLLLTLCRLAALSVGPGRIGSLIADDKSH